jgi:hypothetical protein
MSRLDTDTLIDRLATDAGPVHRVAPLWRRVALWLGLAIPPLLVIVAVHGLAVDMPTLFGDGQLMIEQVAALLTAIFAAAAAFASTIPGASRRWLWLPAVPLAVWLLTLGRGCIDDWLRLGAEGLALRPDTGCLIPMLLMAVVPTGAMLLMLRRGAPLAPRTTLLLGALATAAVVAFGLRFFHIGDASIMVLVWHMGLAAVLCLAAGIAGGRVLGWPTGRETALAR